MYFALKKWIFAEISRNSYSDNGVLYNDNDSMKYYDRNVNKNFFYFYDENLSMMMPLRW